MILIRNPIHAALFLTVNLAGVAALYLMLQAQFLALVQVIVYAGAIAVLFVFAIMVLIPGKEETGPDPLRAQRWLAVPLAGFLLLETLLDPAIDRVPGGPRARWGRRWAGSRCTACSSPTSSSPSRSPRCCSSPPWSGSWP